MNKTSIKRSILDYTGGAPFVSVSSLAKMLGVGRDSTRALLQGLPYIPQGRRKDYLVDDVAERLADLKRY